MLVDFRRVVFTHAKRFRSVCVRRVPYRSHSRRTSCPKKTIPFRGRFEPGTCRCSNFEDICYTTRATGVSTNIFTILRFCQELSRKLFLNRPWFNHVSPVTSQSNFLDRSRRFNLPITDAPIHRWTNSTRPSITPYLLYRRVLFFITVVSFH